MGNIRRAKPALVYWWRLSRAAGKRHRKPYAFVSTLRLWYRNKKSQINDAVLVDLFKQLRNVDRQISNLKRRRTKETLKRRLPELHNKSNLIVKKIRRRGRQLGVLD